MAMKPYVKPRSLKRKPKTEIPSLNEWKASWEFTHRNPLPIGNPYSHQLLHYAAKKEMYSRSRTRREKYQAITPDITASAGDILPRTSKRHVTRLFGKGVARLHPVTGTLMAIDDAITLYGMLK